MASSTFVGAIQDSTEFDPEKNVFQSIWEEYERVIIESLITSFGLDFIVHDQHGGDVDTIHNVREMSKDPELRYKNKQNQENYENRGKYNSNAYHEDKDYIRINAEYSKNKKEGKLTDAYTGNKAAKNANIDLDHIIAAKEIHDDPGRVLAGLDGVDLANNKDNLAPTDRNINRSMQQKDMEKYLEQWKQKQPERQSRIKELKGQSELSDKERKELAKLEKLEEIDPDLMMDEYKKAKKFYEAKVNRAYYTSPKFVKDTAVAAGKRGAEMGLRQALGFIFTEIWFCAKAELQNMPAGTGLEEMLTAVGRGIKLGIKSAKTKYKELFTKVEEGVTAGVLSSLTTTICNIFFTTAKEIVKNIRQIYASVVQAGKVLLFNPDNLMFGDRIKTASVIMATGASVLAGIAAETAVGGILEKIPIIGPIATTFCSCLVSGLLSCTLLIFLDRSKFMNTLIAAMNKVPSEVNNYAEIADIMEELAAKIADIDIVEFKKETEKFRSIAEQISYCKDDNDLNKTLLLAYEELNISIPWNGEFDEFMNKDTNRMVFS